MVDSKILIICNCASGLNDFRGMLIDELINLKNEVYAIVPTSSFEEEILAEMDLITRGCKLIKVAIDRRGINPITDINLFIKYKKVISEVKPTLVITYTIKPNVYGGFACRLINIPYVINITGLGTAFQKKGIIRNIVVKLYKIACKNAKVVFFENEENRQLFIKEGITKASQTYRLNGAGVDLEKFQPTKYPSEEMIHFLFMGRVMAEKGIDELFSAMKKLVIDGVKCKLDVLGGYEEDYKSIIEKNVAEGWLNYYGYQKDVRPYIKKCSCFVLPSWHEGMANTNLESAASGRPVITSNIHGCLEAVIDGKTGYLVERKNADDLYRAMKKFSELSYEERRNMGLAGRKHMKEHFDKKRVVEETINIIIRNGDKSIWIH